MTSATPQTNTKLLRELFRAMEERGCLTYEARKWGMEVIENACRLVDGAGRNPEANYARLERAVRGN